MRESWHGIDPNWKNIILTRIDMIRFWNSSELRTPPFVNRKKSKYNRRPLIRDQLEIMLEGEDYDSIRQNIRLEGEGIDFLENGCSELKT